MTITSLDTGLSLVRLLTFNESSGEFEIMQLFSSEGLYRLDVRVRDDEGDEGFATFEVLVEQDPAP